MAWITGHTRLWRAAGLVLMVVAFLGPWVFDQINVPAQYTCDPPFIRLEGDFCGVPLSGMWVLYALSSEFISTVAGMVTGKLVFAELGRQLLIIPLGCLLLLPVFTTLLLIWKGNRRWLQIFHLAILCLTEGLMLWALSATPDLRTGRLWGVWLYTILIFSLMMLEVLVFARRKAPDQSG